MPFEKLLLATNDCKRLAESASCRDTRNVLRNLSQQTMFMARSKDIVFVIRSLDSEIRKRPIRPLDHPLDRLHWRPSNCNVLWVWTSKVCSWQIVGWHVEAGWPYRYDDHTGCVIPGSMLAAAVLTKLVWHVLLMLDWFTSWSAEVQRLNYIRNSNRYRTLWSLLSWKTLHFFKKFSRAPSSEQEVTVDEEDKIYERFSLNAVEFMNLTNKEVYSVWQAQREPY